MYKILNFFWFGCLLMLFDFSHASEHFRRTIETINDHWTFNYFPQAEIGDREFLPDFDDSQWQNISIPHTWQTYETTQELHPFIASASELDDPYWWHGWGWYRKRFIIPEEYENKKVFIEFDGVQKICEVWLNGEKLGKHQGGFNTFYFDLTDKLKLGEENVLAVAVSNRRIDPYRTPPMTAGNWNIYGGIYRDVRIVIKEKVHIPFQGSHLHEGGTFVTTPMVDDEKGQVNIKTWVKNEESGPQLIQLVTSIQDSDGMLIEKLEMSQEIQSGEIKKFQQLSQIIDSPQLWSHETPNMYRVISEVYHDGKKRDHFESPLGFRWFEWDYIENRLYLNGEAVHLHGTCLLPDYPWLGEAIPRWVHDMDLEDIRYNLNHNAIRPHVATADPYVYDWCDNHGLLSVQEVPNFKSLDFSEEIQEQMVRQMIRRDRNHPSIFLWSVGNETTDAADTKWVVEEDTSRIVHARHIYNDSAGDFVQHSDQNMDLENLLRCTVRGWTHSGVMDLEPLNNQHTGHEGHQHRMARVQGGSQRGRIDMINGMMFAYNDYGCDREYKSNPIKHLNPKGWVDSYRVPKYIYYLWQANYAEKPMVFIHPHYWKSSYLGKSKDFVVDSNCDEVELFVNGKSMGVKKPSWQNFHTVTFRNIEVTNGEIKAIARMGDEVVEHVVPMAGKPHQIVVETSHPEISAGLASVFYVKADILDESGNRVQGANNTLEWHAKGPVTLVGPNEYVSDRDDHEKMLGAMYIDTPIFNVFRSNGEAGEIEIMVSSDGLREAKITINATQPYRSKDRVVIEPQLSGAGRALVRRDPNIVIEEVSSYSAKFNYTDQDLFLEGEDLEWQLSEILQGRYPEMDPRRPEFRELLSQLFQILEKNNGLIVADDYNFIVGQLNAK